MNIAEALTRMSDAPQGSALVAKPPFTVGSEAVFVELTDEGGVPAEVTSAGFEYLLGRDDIEELLRFLEQKQVSSESVAEFIIYYAVNDSFPAWIDDVPDVNQAHG